jgi:serine/threonine protein kinase
MLRADDSLDGYRLKRRIGAGGFGEVWLCQKEQSDEFRALKFIPDTDTGRLVKEFEAVCRFRAAAEELEYPSLIPIEHVSWWKNGLFYVMPLADGDSACPPTDPNWFPLTLTYVIEWKKYQPTWLTAQEIRDSMVPLLVALQILSDAGLVHRDVKPDNILLLNYMPCLADISLLSADSGSTTRRGTPGYSAPSWFLESGGHPDMYGAATTLYSLLTGNPPDKMGRAAFRWPPQGEDSLSSEERAHWIRMHSVIRRAIDDRPAERFIDFMAFANALLPPDPKTDLHGSGDTVSGDTDLLSADELPESSPLSPATKPPLRSEIPWLSVGRIIDMLEKLGFEQISFDSTLFAFRKQINSEDALAGVSVGMHINPIQRSIWMFRCIRVSNGPALECDIRSFEEGILAMCGIFVSDKEWDAIREFIDKPLRQIGNGILHKEAMLFQDAFLKAEYAKVIRVDGVDAWQQSFSISSKE